MKKGEGQRLPPSGRRRCRRKAHIVNSSFTGSSMLVLRSTLVDTFLKLKFFYTSLFFSSMDQSWVSPEWRSSSFLWQFQYPQNISFPFAGFDFSLGLFPVSAWQFHPTACALFAFSWLSETRCLGSLRFRFFVSQRRKNSAWGKVTGFTNTGRL